MTNAGLLIHESRLSGYSRTLLVVIERVLTDLGMKNSKFKIDLVHSDNFYKKGMDEIQFLFKANKGYDFKKIKEAASGGEMSRIMLAIKSIMANYNQLPSIIFDEIDTGVSGEISKENGNNYEES